MVKSITSRVGTLGLTDEITGDMCDELELRFLVLVLDWIGVGGKFMLGNGADGTSSPMSSVSSESAGLCGGERTRWVPRR